MLSRRGPDTFLLYCVVRRIVFFRTTRLQDWGNPKGLTGSMRMGRRATSSCFTSETTVTKSSALQSPLLSSGIAFDVFIHFVPEILLQRERVKQRSVREQSDTSGHSQTPQSEGLCGVPSLHNPSMNCAGDSAVSVWWGEAQHKPQQWKT